VWCSPERGPPVNAMAAEAAAQIITTALTANGIAGGTVIDGSSSACLDFMCQFRA